MEGKRLILVEAPIVDMEIPIYYPLPGTIYPTEDIKLYYKSTKEEVPINTLRQLNTLQLQRSSAQILRGRMFI